MAACTPVDLADLGDGAKPDATETIRIGGSTTLLGPFDHLAEAFTERYPQYRVENTGDGSGNGIANLLKGRINLARSSRPVNTDEMEIATAKSMAMDSYQIGFDAVLVVVHPDKIQFVDRITMEQLKGIFFTGAIHDWSELSPALSGPINVYGRPAGESGTASLFMTTVMGPGHYSHAPGTHLLKQTPALAEAVAADPDGIAYLPAVHLTDAVRDLALPGLDGDMVRYSPDAVLADRYPLKRNLWVVSPDPVARKEGRFLDFVLSRDGQSILAKNGIIPIR